MNNKSNTMMNNIIIFKNKSNNMMNNMMNNIIIFKNIII